MKRIGIAASRISKGNLLLYNFYVILLSILFSLVIFFLSSFTLLVSFAILSFISKGFMVFEPDSGLSSTFTVCMAALAIVVAVISLAAILINIKLK